MKAITKRWLGLCVSAFLCTLLANADTYNLTFNIEDFEIIQQDGVVSITPLKPSYTFDLDTSLPALPYFTQQILIDGKCKPETFSFEVEEKVLIASDIYVTPNQESVPTNSMMTLDVVQKTDPQYSEAIYPNVTVRYVYGMTDREGKEHSFLVICPFEYDVERNCLYFIPFIRVSYDKQPTVANYTSSRTNDEVKYLIVTADSLAEAFKPMRDWKTIKGVKTKIITTETIYSAYPGTSRQEQIKRCLSDYYYNHGMEWVLLGGDTIVVPTRMCYIFYSGSEDPNNNYSTTVASDAYYANFEGSFDWNADNDHYYGETSDNVNLTPHINVSRLPIRTVADVEQYVEKLVAYERGENFGSWMGNMLLSASEIDTTYNGLSDAHIDTEEMFEDSIQPYLNDLQKYAFYDTGNNLGYTGRDSILNKENLLKAFNSVKPHYMHMATHGLLDFWQLDEGIFQAADVQSISNVGMPMIITSEACYSNDFTCFYDPGLSEAFIRKKDSGALAFWGSAHNGWTYFSTKLCGAFWRCIGNPSRNFTKAIAYSKSQYLPYSNEYSHIRSLLLSMNAVGDSELEIYRPNPIPITDVDIAITPSKVVVYSDFSYDVAITSKEDAGGSLFYTGVRGGEVATNLPLTIYLSHSKDNRIPYCVETGRYVLTGGNSLLYLQNLKYIGRNISYTADYTIIGKDIDGEQENGPVVIEGGVHFNVESTYNTTISNNFKCEKGSTLVIK